MLKARSDHLLSTVVLVEKSGKFYCYEPELGLLASDDSVEGAYNKFMEAKCRFIAEVEQAGLTANGLAPVVHGTERAQLISGRGIANELGLFLVKICIVLIVVAGVGGTAVVAVKRSVEDASIRSISMVDIAKKAADIVRDVQAMPQDLKESMRQNIGILSREATPFVEAWRNSPPSAELKTDPTAPATSKPNR